MLVLTQQKGLNSEVPNVRREAIRSELEATRAAFHQILGSVTEAGWHKKSSSSAWKVGEVFVHLTWALEYLPEEVHRARRGRGMFNMPKRVSDTLSYWYIRWLARAASPDSIRRRYDHAMDKTIALLETIPVEDWELGANFYGEGFHSIEDLFHVPAQHLAEHTR